MRKYKSQRWTLKMLDIIKGLVMGIGTPLLYYIQEAIPGYNIATEWKIVISAFVTYVLKNLVTDDVKVAQKTLSKAEPVNKEGNFDVPKS